MPTRAALNLHTSFEPMKPFLDRFKRNEEDDQTVPPAAGDPSAGDVSAASLEEAVPNQEAPPREQEEELVLQLGDFLHRIPAELLTQEPHDVTRNLKFPLTEVANWIAERSTSIPLVVLYRLLPDIFAREITEADQIQIRFPWQKILYLINQSAANASADSLAVKLKTRCTIQNVGPMGPAAVPVSAMDAKAAAAATPGQPGGTWLSRARLSAHAAQAAADGTGGGNRSPKEYQRTITELNRRIIALEGSQKERAQELAKEKEMRIKLERQLASTERALAESANLVENTRFETRREYETDLCRREAETSRTQKELQNQVERLKEELERVKRERDDSRDKAQEEDEGPVEIADSQFEGDIANYRERIKVLLNERDALVREKQELLKKIEASGQEQPF